MSKKTRLKKELTVWHAYTGRLSEILKSQEAEMMMVEETQMLGLIASSQSPTEHLQRLNRYINWYTTTPIEPELLELYSREPENALELWIHNLQPSGISRQTLLRKQIEAEYKEMGREAPPIVFGISSRDGTLKNQKFYINDIFDELLSNAHSKQSNQTADTG